MARKNGKTALIAALVLVHLVGPEARFGQQIYSAANDKEQAALIYSAAAAMVEMDEDLSALVRPVPSRKRLVCQMFGSFYAALSADAKTKHGLNPALWIYDELAQAPKRQLYDALDTSQGAQDEPLGIVISTQAESPNSLMSELVDDANRVLRGEVQDDTLAAFIFEVPRDADPFDEKLWPLANPGLGDFLSIDELRAQAAKAKRLPSRRAVFRNLHLNQQVDASANQLIGREDWERCGGAVDLEALRGRPMIGALDLAQRRDLTAFVGVFDDDPASVIVRCWTPEHGLAERAERDRAPYREWVEAGHLIATPGRVIDYGFVARELSDLRDAYDLRAVAFDPWKIEDLKRALRDIGVDYYVDGEDDPIPGALRLVKIIQGFRSLSPCVDAVEEAIVAGALRHGMHPVLTWAASNAVATHDAAMNRKLDKVKARNKIDPFVALTMAVGLAARSEPEEEASESVYNELARLKARAQQATPAA